MCDPELIRESQRLLNRARLISEQSAQTIRIGGRTHPTSRPPPGAFEYRVSTLEQFGMRTSSRPPGRCPSPGQSSGAERCGVTEIRSARVAQGRTARFGHKPAKGETLSDLIDDQDDDPALLEQRIGQLVGVDENRASASRNGQVLT